MGWSDILEAQLFKPVCFGHAQANAEFKKHNYMN